ncbi:hypothetical protein RUND412_000465 [Rhizina undulata]
MKSLQLIELHPRNPPTPSKLYEHLIWVVPTETSTYKLFLKKIYESYPSFFDLEALDGGKDEVNINPVFCTPDGTEYEIVGNRSVYTSWKLLVYFEDREPEKCYIEFTIPGVVTKPPWEESYIGIPKHILDPRYPTIDVSKLPDFPPGYSEANLITTSLSIFQVPEESAQPLNLQPARPSITSGSSEDVHSNYPGTSGITTATETSTEHIGGHVSKRDLEIPPANEFEGSKPVPDESDFAKEPAALPLPSHPHVHSQEPLTSPKQPASPRKPQSAFEAYCTKIDESKAGSADTGVPAAIGQKRKEKSIFDQYSRPQFTTPPLGNKLSVGFTAASTTEGTVEHLAKKPKGSNRVSVLDGPPPVRMVIQGSLKTPELPASQQSEHRISSVVGLGANAPRLVVDGRLKAKGRAQRRRQTNDPSEFLVKPSFSPVGNDEGEKKQAIQPPECPQS